MIPRETLERWRELPEIDRRAQDLIDRAGFHDNYTDRARAADRRHKARDEAIEAIPALIAEIEGLVRENERLRTELANSIKLGPPRRSEPFVFDPEGTYGGSMVDEKDVAATTEIERLRNLVRGISEVLYEQEVTLTPDGRFFMDGMELYTHDEDENPPETP